MLEECRAGCPEGTDEECEMYGIGMVCYDLTGNDLICEEPNVGVKEKGDPQTVSCTEYRIEHSLSSFFRHADPSMFSAGADPITMTCLPPVPNAVLKPLNVTKVKFASRDRNA